MRLRAAQGALSGAANMAVENLQSLVSLETADEKQTITLLTKLVNTSVNSLRLLSHANMMINNVRRELLKFFINKKYHSVCKPSRTLTCKLLMGEDFAAKLKALDKTIKIGKPSYNSGFARGKRFHPFSQGHFTFRFCCSDLVIPSQNFIFFVCHILPVCSML